MLDIKFVRENPEVVKENIKKKFQDQKLPLVDEVIALDQENRNIKQEVEGLRANKNKISKQIGALMAQGKKRRSGRSEKRDRSFRRSYRRAVCKRKRSGRKTSKKYDDDPEHY